MIASRLKPLPQVAPHTDSDWSREMYALVTKRNTGVIASPHPLSRPAAGNSFGGIKRTAGSHPTKEFPTDWKFFFSPKQFSDYAGVSILRWRQAYCLGRISVLGWIIGNVCSGAGAPPLPRNIQSFFRLQTEMHPLICHEIPIDLPLIMMNNYSIMLDNSRSLVYCITYRIIYQY